MGRRGINRAIRRSLNNAGITKSYSSIFKENRAQKKNTTQEFEELGPVGKVIAIIFVILLMCLFFS